MNGGPHSYTRFNLTQNMEGDNSQVEMKMSNDMDEEIGENGLGDKHRTTARIPSMAQKGSWTPKTLGILASAVVLAFIIGMSELLNNNNKKKKTFLGFLLFLTYS